MANSAVVSHIVLLWVWICLATGSTGAAFSLEEEFLHLKENYIQMKQVVKNLESKVTELEAKVQQQDSLLTSLLREKNERTAATGFDSIPISTNQSAVAINGSLPSSCSDLRIMGHIWSGFYSVMGSAMMESVYCDFTKLPDDADFQKWIGYADVKSTPVYFFVQTASNSPANYPGPINFSTALLNVGNAMQLRGIFTAPRPGIYFFLFNGMAEFPASSSSPRLAVQLCSTSGPYVSSYVSEGTTVDLHRSPLASQSMLTLKAGDNVWLQIDYFTYGMTLYGVNFFGIMLEEEIAVSL